MWSVERRNHSIFSFAHDKPDPRASAFHNDAALGLEQTFYVLPGNGWTDRIGEYGLQSFPVFVVHGMMVLLYSDMSRYIFIAITISSAIVFLWIIGFRLNPTLSLPLGLYRLTDAPIRIGMPAFFCLELDEYINLAADRGYAGFGSCPGGLRPLGKEIYGLPGDRIDIDHGQIRINGRLLPGSAVKDRDRQGRAMPVPWLRPGVIPEGKALMLSLHHAGSFDSRYFGLVSLAALRLVEPVFTWNN